MKKLLFTIAVLMASLPIGAQDILKFEREEYDELLGRSGNVTAYTDHVMIELSDNGRVRWWITNPPHIFVPDRLPLTGQRGYTCNVVVGLYTAAGTILAKCEKWRGIPSETGTSLIMGAKGKVESIHKRKKTEMTIYDLLQQTKHYPGSYIRLVIHVYGGSLMDVKFRLPDELYGVPVTTESNPE